MSDVTPPAGYTLDAPSTPALPAGYSLDAGNAQPAVPVAATTTPDDPSVLDQLGRSVALTGRGLAHGATSLLGVVNDPIVAGVNAAESGLGIDPKYRLGNTSQATDMALNAAGVPQVTPQNGSERLASGLAQGLGGVATGVGVGSALANASSPAVSAVGSALASNPGSQIAAATTGTAAQNIAEANGASPGVQAAAGALGGLAPTAIGATAGGTVRALAGNIPASRQALAQRASDLGIDLTAPQLSKSLPMKVADSVSSQFPFSGAGSFAEKQQGQFNNAVAKTIGLPGAEAITPDIFNQAKQQASQGFENLWNNNNLKVTPSLFTKANQVAEEGLRNSGLDAGSPLRNTISRIAELANMGGGTISGTEFQGLDSSLGQVSAEGGVVGHYAGKLQEVLRDGMQQGMSPGDASQLQQLRGQWQNIKAITNLVAKAQDGNIPPSQLMGAIANSGSGKNAVATGNRGDLGDLAMIGQHFLKQSVPDSGTALRNTTFDALKGLGAVAAGVPTVGLPAVAATLGGARAVSQGLRSRTLYNALMPAQQPASNNALSAYLGTIPVQQNALSKP